MSAKRQAETQLGPDNWDEEEPAEKEEDGGFKLAPKEILEKRVIRTAKRRSLATGDAVQKTIFSGFSGFNKTQKSSFDFLANLTNGSKSNNGSSTLKSDTAAVSSSSMITKTASSPPSGIFSLSRTSPIKNSPFGQSESTIFSEARGTPAFTQSVFSSSKPDSTVNDNPFKGQSSVTSTPYAPFPLNSNANPDKPIPQVTSSLFGLSPTNVNHNNSPFSTKPNNTTACKAPTMLHHVASSTLSTEVKPDVNDEKEFDYYNKLKGLNISVSAWIKKHIDETPVCILTPIFKDYETHLKNIQDEYNKSKKELPLKMISDTKDNNKERESPITLSNSPALSNSVFSVTPSTTSPIVEKKFTFGINTPATTSTNSFATTVTPSTGFSFGIKPSSAITSPFATNPTTSDNNGSTPFSFGIGKPFAFNTNIKKSDEPINEGVDNEDEPPKVEYTPIEEENSVYDRKCKVFVKKDGNFIDKGVGTLYIKKIEETGKYQLLVRANTALGNILINMILSSSLPTQRMGKNNVMMVCIPTPDAKPPPTSILIRVKTSEDADELLETLNKYKA